MSSVRVRSGSQCSVYAHTEWRETADGNLDSMAQTPGPKI